MFSLLDSIACGAQWVGPYTYIIKWKKEAIKDSGYHFLTPAFYIIWVLLTFYDDMFQPAFAKQKERSEEKVGKSLIS